MARRNNPLGSRSNGLPALSAFGETDDFTSATRPHSDATRFVDAPSADLDFFWKATAMDPRPILLHEGVPGHYLQLVLSWANKDPIRRHFYDSSPPKASATILKK